MGLLSKWWKQYQPDFKVCMNGDPLYNVLTKKKKNDSITLVNLSGGFVVLLGGYLLALAAFIAEMLSVRLKLCKKNVF